MASIVSLVCVGWLIACCPAVAGGEDGRFLEFKTDAVTVTYDLSTKQMIVPGRFTIIKTTIDNRDVMRLKLNALSIMPTYCTRPDGKFPPPAALLMLGKPDMPIKDVEVGTYQATRSGMISRWKGLIWYYPYKMLSSNGTVEGSDIFRCNSTSSEIMEQQKLITSGLRTKWLFDCNRGLVGLYRNEDDQEPMVVLDAWNSSLEGYIVLCGNLPPQTSLYTPK
jgi:hypothetical protein